jgi:hypothetical protein
MGLANNGNGSGEIRDKTGRRCVFLPYRFAEIHPIDPVFPRGGRPP